MPKDSLEPPVCNFLLSPLIILFIDHCWNFLAGTITYAGPPSGTIISYLISGVLIDAAGWRSPFYFFGGLSVIWSAIFFLIGSDSPATSFKKPFCNISETERKYIEGNLGISEEETTDGHKVSSFHNLIIEVFC